jgi:hypothetical protein
VKEFKIEDDRLFVTSDEGKNGIVWRRAEWRECYTCGIMFPFEQHYTTREQNAGKFCSRKCDGQWRRKQHSRKRPSKQCVICGQRFEVIRSKAHRYATCGRQYCRTKHRSNNSKAMHAKHRANKI